MRITICSLLLLLCVGSCKKHAEGTKAERIDHLMQEVFDNKEFTGNILVAEQEEIIYRKSFGMADRENGIPNTDTTRFLIASASKPITAILILRLADKGILKLEDTIDKYFTNAAPQISKVSIHQLLTHTSGINEIINEEKGMDINVQLRKATFGFEPGSDFQYSNSGYVILKEIAQIAAGKGYAELVRAEIFDPAGMNSSGVARSSNLRKLAKGYTDATQTESASPDFPMENIDGAGSLYSTTEDLYKLDRALYGDSLLPSGMKEQMLKQHIPEKYSYGWFVREKGGLWDVYYHKGNLPGFVSFITRRTQKNQFVIILSNAGSADLSDIESDIHRILKAQR